MKVKVKHLVLLPVVIWGACVLCSDARDVEMIEAEAVRGGEPNFDYFMLALTWPNQYCLSASCNPSVPKQYFTIHGLWPQLNLASSPQYCKTTQQLTDATLAEVKDDLLTYWPDLKNAEDFDKSKRFWKYEWKKHGTCSSNKFTALQYLQSSIALAKQYSNIVLEALNDGGVKPDGSSTYHQFHVLSAIYKATGAAPSLSVKSNALAEVRLCLKNDAVTLIDCDHPITFAASPALAPSPSPSTSLPPSRSTRVMKKLKQARKLFEVTKYDVRSKQQQTSVGATLSKLLKNWKVQAREGVSAVLSKKVSRTISFRESMAHNHRCVQLDGR